MQHEHSTSGRLVSSESEGSAGLLGEPLGWNEVDKEALPEEVIVLGRLKGCGPYSDGCNCTLDCSPWSPKRPREFLELVVEQSAVKHLMLFKQRLDGTVPLRELLWKVRKAWVDVAKVAVLEICCSCLLEKEMRAYYTIDLPKFTKLPISDGTVPANWLLARSIYSA